MYFRTEFVDGGVLLNTRSGNAQLSGKNSIFSSLQSDREFVRDRCEGHQHYLPAGNQ